MSTRSNRARHAPAPKTNPKWYPTTQGLNRWLNKMAHRSDLTVRVLRNTGGAPARFVPAEAEIDLNEGLIESIDPKIAGSPEFVVRHRAVAGACVHEACHARHSVKINLNQMGRQHGARHTGVFSMLEEGRCETQQWPDLTGVERLALQSMVLEIVLKDMEDENGETQAIDMRGVVRLAGLLMARINTGIVDISQPLGGRMNDALIDTLGPDYATLYDLAVRFSAISVEYYGAGLDELHALVREWIAVEDRIVPKDKPGGGEDGEPGEEGGEPGGEPGGKSKPKDKPKDEESKDGEGGGKGDEPKDEGDEGDESKDEPSKGEGDEQGESDDTPGDDDEGEVGDGSKALHETDPDSDAALGDYASSNPDAGTFEDIFQSVRDAAEEAEKVSGSRLREELVAIHRATAGSHAERRRKNAEAMKRWRR